MMTSILLPIEPKDLPPSLGFERITFMATTTDSLLRLHSIDPMNHAPVTNAGSPSSLADLSRAFELATGWTLNATCQTRTEQVAMSRMRNNATSFRSHELIIDDLSDLALGKATVGRRYAAKLVKAINAFVENQRLEMSRALHSGGRRRHHSCVATFRVPVLSNFEIGIASHRCEPSVREFFTTRNGDVLVLIAELDNRHSHDSSNWQDDFDLAKTRLETAFLCYAESLEEPIRILDSLKSVLQRFSFGDVTANLSLIIVRDRQFEIDYVAFENQPNASIILDGTLGRIATGFQDNAVSSKQQRPAIDGPREVICNRHWIGYGQSWALMPKIRELPSWSEVFGDLSLCDVSKLSVNSMLMRIEESVARMHKTSTSQNEPHCIDSCPILIRRRA